MLELSKNSKIVHTAGNWVLTIGVEKTKIKEGIKVPYVSTTETYHANLNQALKRFCDSEFSKATRIDQLLAIIEELNTKIDNLKL